MELPFEIKEFDNEITLRYKWSDAFNVPSRLILVTVDKKSNRNIFMTLAVFIETNNDVTISELSELIWDIDDDIHVLDIAMTFVELAVKSSIDRSEIIDVLNELAETNTLLSSFQSWFEVDYYYQSWKTQTDKELRDDRRKLQKILDVQEHLKEYDPIKNTKFTVERKVLQLKTLIRGKPTTVQDGLDIFNFCTCSLYVPFIQYNGATSRKKWYKVYQGETADEIPRYDNLIPDRTDSLMISNFIFFSIWMGKGDASKSTKESYVTVRYNLKRSELEAEIAVKDSSSISDLERHIRDSLPSFVNLSAIQESKISGSFYFKNISIRYDSFCHMLSTEPIFYTYVFNSESSNSQAEKSRITLHYKSLTHYQDEKAISDRVKLRSEFQFRLPEFSETSDLLVHVHGARSIIPINEFISIFSRLLAYYSKQRDEIEKMYDSVIPEGVRNFEIIEEQIRNKKSNKVDILKGIAPDVFLNKYARSCQAEQHPTILLNDEDITEWRNQTFVYRGEELQRQVLQFPSENPLFYFGCPNDKFPFPGITTNNSIENQEMYPYVPCCYQSNQIGKNPLLMEKYYGIEVKPKRARTGKHVLKTRKVLNMGRTGVIIESGITDLLFHAEKGKYLRYGSPFSQNSFLHCVCIALGVEEYFESKDKEEYISSLRQTCIRSIEPSLLKQQMYDQSLDNIVNSGMNIEGFFDSLSYFRMIEELFQINVFIFSPGESNNGELESGRFKNFPIHTFDPTKPCVCIYRHFGSEATTLVTPHHELLVRRYENDNTAFQMMFDSKFGAVLHKARIETQRVFTWNILDDRKKQIFLRQNIYSQPKINIPYSIVGQYIDTDGKGRALICKIENSYFTLCGLPSAPLNVPLVNVLVSCPIELAMRIMSVKPTSVSVEYNQINGLWYPQHDLNNALYIPIHPIDVSELNNISKKYNVKLVYGGGNPIMSTGNNIVIRTLRLRRTIDILLQLIKWVFYVYLREYESGSPSDFIIRYTTVLENEPEDSAYYYDFSNLSYRYPIVNGVFEALRYLNKYIETLSTGTHLIFTNPVFQDKIKKYLIQNMKENYGLSLEIPTVIRNMYVSELDFQQQQHVAVFINEKDFIDWYRETILRKKISTTIRYTVSRSFLNEKLPYLYQVTEDRGVPIGLIYQVQNVVSGDFALDNALGVSEVWDVEKINLGWAPKFNDEMIPKEIRIPRNRKLPRITFGIASDGNIYVKDVLRVEGTKYWLQILHYGANDYAAMLPMN